MIRDGCANKQPVGVCLRALTVLNSYIRPYFMDKDTKFRIVLVEDENIIKKILKHLGLWDRKARPPPKANALAVVQEYHIDYSDSQVPVSDDYLYVDRQYPEAYTA